VCSFTINKENYNATGQMKSPLQKGSSRLIVLACSNWGLRWRGFIDNKKGEWWLIAQLLLITAHAMPALPALPTLKKFGFNWAEPFMIIGFCFLLLGIVIISRAFLSLGVNLSPLPEPKDGASLVTLGSYKNCRHPLYKGLIISSTGVMFTLGSMLHLFLLICLCALLIGKAKREEQYLQRKYPEYRNYLSRTPAIIQSIPFLDWRE